MSILEMRLEAVALVKELRIWIIQLELRHSTLNEKIGVLETRFDEMRRHVDAELLEMWNFLRSNVEQEKGEIEMIRSLPMGQSDSSIATHPLHKPL